jgi:hypothetical protein
VALARVNQTSQQTLRSPLTFIKEFSAERQS